MSGEEILEDVKTYTTIEEIQKNNWIKDFGQREKGVQVVNPNECLDTKVNIWIFRHLYEEGLWAKFKENEDGSWTFISCRDEQSSNS